MAACGTYAGYQQHVKFGTPACTECRAACAAYARERRTKLPDGYARERDEAKLRDRALRILGQRHPTELQMIMSDLRGLNA